MTDKDAIKKQLGGEVICRVFNVKNSKDPVIVPDSVNITIEGNTINFKGLKVRWL